MDNDDALCDVTQLETELEEALAALDEEIRQHGETQKSLAALTTANNELSLALANAESKLAELERSVRRQGMRSDVGNAPEDTTVDAKQRGGKTEKRLSDKESQSFAPLSDPHIIADTSIGWLARGTEAAFERLHDDSLPAAARLELFLDTKPRATTSAEERVLENQVANDLASQANGKLTIFELIDTSGRPYDEAAQLMVDLLIAGVLRLPMKTSSSGVLL